VDVSNVRTTSKAPFVALEVQVARDADWSQSVIAYVAPRSGRVVAVDR
jgi:hypothetical protein